MVVYVDHGVVVAIDHDDVIDCLSNPARGVHITKSVAFAGFS